MMREKSCGAIVWRRKKELEFLLVQQKSKRWGFPKGHVERNESERETALREVKEETGLQVKLLADFRRALRYSSRKGRSKLVVFFIGEAIGGKLAAPNDEILAHRWVSYEEAVALLSFENARQLLKAASNHIISSSLENRPSSSPGQAPSSPQQ
jgi:tRNA nucleotidyltransferase (CCA-adding enzyme)